MPTQRIYRGWIHGQQDDAEVLTQLGVKLGPWREDINAWSPCDVTPRALDALDRMWGRFIWGFEVVEVEA